MHPWEGKVQGKTVDGQSQQAVNSQLTGLEKQGQVALETGSPPGWGACHVWGRLEHLISSAWPFRDISPDSILPEPLTYLHLFPCPFQGSPTTLYFLGCPIPRSLYLFNHLQAGTITLFNSYLLSTCSMPGNGLDSGCMALPCVITLLGSPHRWAPGSRRMPHSSMGTVFHLACGNQSHSRLWKE